MVRVLVCFTIIIFLSSCGGTEAENISKEEANKEQTEKAIKPLPKTVNNRISIKQQFIPDEDSEIFVLDLKGENLRDSELSFVILNKKRDTLFSRTSIKGEILLHGFNSNDENEKVNYIFQKMSTFFSVKNFSTPPYTINDPNSDDFDGDIKVWNEIEGDSSVVCFEYSLLPDGGSEVIVYSRLLDSILVYDRTH